MCFLGIDKCIDTSLTCVADNEKRSCFSIKALLQTRRCMTVLAVAFLNFDIDIPAIQKCFHTSLEEKVRNSNDFLLVMRAKCSDRTRPYCPDEEKLVYRYYVF